MIAYWQMLQYLGDVTGVTLSAVAERRILEEVTEEVEAQLERARKGSAVDIHTLTSMAKVYYGIMKRSVPDEWLEALDELHGGAELTPEREETVRAFITVVRMARIHVEQVAAIQWYPGLMPRELSHAELEHVKKVVAREVRVDAPMIDVVQGTISALNFIVHDIAEVGGLLEIFEAERWGRKTLVWYYRTLYEEARRLTDQASYDELKYEMKAVHRKAEEDRRRVSIPEALKLLQDAEVMCEDEVESITESFDHDFPSEKLAPLSAFSLIDRWHTSLFDYDSW